MLKKNQNIRLNLNNILSPLILILIIFFTRINILFAGNINWVEVSKTNVGIQYLDRDSIYTKGRGIVELTTKYLKVNSNDSKKIEENIYTMEINCVTNKFKDITINGKKNLTAKWLDPNGDKLIDDVISYSCENV